MWRAGSWFGWSIAGSAPVVDLRERQVCRGAEVLLLALVGVRAVEVVEAPLSENRLDAVGQERLGLIGRGAALHLRLVTALAWLGLGLG